MNLHEKGKQAQWKKKNNKLVKTIIANKVHEMRLQLQILYMSRNETQN